MHTTLIKNNTSLYKINFVTLIFNDFSQSLLLANIPTVGSDQPKRSRLHTYNISSPELLPAREQSNRKKYI